SSYANPNLSKYNNYSSGGTSLVEPTNQFVPDIKPVDSSDPNALKTQEPIDPNIAVATFSYKFNKKKK
ncbi:MAG: hypothetical protein HUJ97_10110, partial [Bacteroidales bacterium]|nr:hypothetical protein [Bacteroidales bacterium]